MVRRYVSTISNFNLHIFALFSPMRHTCSAAELSLHIKLIRMKDILIRIILVRCKHMQAMNQFIGELIGCRIPHGAEQDGKFIPRIPAPQVCAKVMGQVLSHCCLVRQETAQCLCTTHNI
jgi:hypothetical protein